MKILFWGKGKNSLDKAMEKILTAENAQKITDAALEARCTRWAEMVTEYALCCIKALSEEGKYRAYYNLYCNGEIAKEITPDTLTQKMCSRIEEITCHRLTVLGYKVVLSYYGPNRMIEISWERKEEKKS